MSAINLYVAVDWQGDREIERAGGEARGGGRDRAGVNEREMRRDGEGARGSRETGEREREIRRGAGREKRGERECTHKPSDIPFLLIEIQFEAKQARQF